MAPLSQTAAHRDMNQAARLDTLSALYRQAELELADRNAAYADRRQKLGNLLHRSGFSRDEADTMFEAYERMWTPEFGAAGSRLPGNDAARRLHDAAMRAGVPPEEWQAFVAAVNDYRLAENRSNTISGHLYGEGGSEKLRASRGEVETMLEMKSELVRAARRINPDLDIRAVHRMAENPDVAGPARFDPLRRTVAFALDPTMANASSTQVKREAYTAVWQSVSGLLTEKERQVLARKFAPNASTVPDGWNVLSEKAAEGFAAYMAPGREKKDRFALFARMERFFGRVANAARGLGYQVPEDIWSRAADGRLADRKAMDAILMPGPGRDASAHRSVKASLGQLSVYELSMLKSKQTTALDAERRRVSSVWRRLVSYNPAVRGIKSVITYINPTAEDAYKQDRRRIGELSRGLGAIEAELYMRKRGLGLQAGQAMINGEGPAPQAPVTPSPQPPVGGPGGSGPHRNADNVLPFGRTGATGQYVVAESFGTGPKGLDYEVRYKDPSGFEQRLAYARNADAAQTCVDAFERVAGRGSAGDEARRLADLANRSGADANLDIHAIKNSGMIDPELDRRINEADVHALVYPLKSGDLVFQGQDGRWRAASLSEFMAYAATSQDSHAENAAKVVSLDVVRESRNVEERLRSGEAAPAQEAPAPAPRSDEERLAAGIANQAGPELPRQAQTDERPAIAARVVPPVPAQKTPALQPPDPTRAVKMEVSLSLEERRSLLRPLKDDQLLQRHADTMAGLAAIDTPRLKLEMDAGRTALEAELKSRGLWQAPLDAAPGRGKGKSKDRGPEL